VRHARNIVLRKRLPAQHLPRVIARTAKLAARSPHLLRKFARVGSALRTSTRLRNGAGGAHRPHRLRLGKRGHRTAGFGVARTPRQARLSAGGGVSLGNGVSRSAGGAVGGVCPNCRHRTFRLRGPVTLTLQSP